MNRMVQEVRRIIFSRTEVVDALMKFAPAVRIDLPPGHITSIKLDEAKGLLVAIEQLGSLSITVHQIGAAKLAVLLMRYCKHRKIPLPKRAAKSIAPGKNEGLALQLTVTINTAPSRRP
jgi:hypothetical protein